MSITNQNENFTATATAAQIAFHKFTRRYVLHARDLAKSGQKDAARDWYRYFQNAQIVKILSAHNAVCDSSHQELNEEIRLLGTECHPLDVVEWSTDIQAIRAALEILVQNLPRKSWGSSTAPRVSQNQHREKSRVLAFEASINWRKSYKRVVK
jgi:hypothetical protein